MAWAERGAALYQWFDERLGLEDFQKLAKKKDVPVHRHTIWYYLGGMTLFLFMVQIVTGILLLFYYRPTADEAFESVQFLMAEVQFGWLVRSVHAWSANLMIFAAFLHFFSVLMLKAYRPPRELTWYSGFVLLALALGFGFTGYLLPWDQLAIWAITVGANMARATPFLGHEGPGAALLAIGDIQLIHSGSDVRFALLAGRFVGEGALLRFYILHCVAIPAAVVILMAVHFWRIRKDGGISAPL